MRVLQFYVLVCLCGALQGAAFNPRTTEASTGISVLSAAPVQWALAQIETGHFKNPDTTKGTSGEISRFQIMPEIWKEYTRSRNYSNPSVAWNVAQQILREREAWFVRATGRRPSAFDLYVMWNKPGLYERVDFNPRRLPQRVRDVARRFENLLQAIR